MHVPWFVSSRQKKECAVRAPRFPAEPSCGGLTFMLPLLRARCRRIRERERTWRDRHDRAVVVDGVDAVLQHLLAGTTWIPSERELVSGACHTVARRSDQAVDCHVRAQVKRVAVHTSVGDVQLQRGQLHGEHVGNVSRGAAQQHAYTIRYWESTSLK